MKSIIIYNSQTGFTKQYADWIAEQTGSETVSFGDAKAKDFSGYDVILFGSWLRAGRIVSVKWFHKLMRRYPDKKYALYGVGASPLESPQVEMFMRKALPEAFRGRCKSFYCPGGLRYDDMSGLSRKMMKTFAKMMASKKDKTEEEKQMAEIISKDYDGSDKKYAAPIAAYVNEMK